MHCESQRVTDVMAVWRRTMTHALKFECRRILLGIIGSAVLYRDMSRDRLLQLRLAGKEIVTRIQVVG